MFMMYILILMVYFFLFGMSFISAVCCFFIFVFLIFSSLATSKNVCTHVIHICTMVIMLAMVGRTCAPGTNMRKTVDKSTIYRCTPIQVCFQESCPMHKNACSMHKMNNAVFLSSFIFYLGYDRPNMQKPARTFHIWYSTQIFAFFFRYILY